MVLPGLRAAGALKGSSGQNKPIVLGACFRIKSQLLSELITLLGCYLPIDFEVHEVD